MKAVILAGGLGTRLSEETDLKPKPMVEIGGKPILWHIMKIYSDYNISDFIICCGYKGYLIKEYFANYFLHTSDVSFNMKTNQTIVLNQKTEPWTVTLVDTGSETLTGGRLLRIQEHIGQDQSFCFTYGDGVADIDISALIKFHKCHGRIATVTAVKPPGRYGALDLDENDEVIEFAEKPLGDGGMINGGFFVLNSEIFRYLSGDDVSFEDEPLKELVRSRELIAYPHTGFWHPMDTLRDKNYLNSLWGQGTAPWKTWA